MAERLAKAEETQPMGPVTRYLVEDVLTKKLRKYGVVVWYDPAQAFRLLVDRLSIERARILRYSGCGRVCRDLSSHREPIAISAPAARAASSFSPSSIGDARSASVNKMNSPRAFITPLRTL